MFYRNPPQCQFIVLIIFPHSPLFPTVLSSPALANIIRTFVRFQQVSLEELRQDPNKKRFAEMLITEVVSQDTGSLRAMEDLIVKIHLSHPLATLDEWIEVMSDQSPSFQRVMLSDESQADFDLDIAIQVTILESLKNIFDLFCLGPGSLPHSCDTGNGTVPGELTRGITLYGRDSLFCMRTDNLQLL